MTIFKQNSIGVWAALVIVTVPHLKASLPKTLSLTLVSSVFHWESTILWVQILKLLHLLSLLSIFFYSLILQLCVYY